MSLASRCAQMSLQRSSSGGTASTTSQPAAASASAARSTPSIAEGCRSIPGTSRTTAARRGASGPSSGTVTDRGSRGSRPWSTPRAVRRSATDRAIGPSVSITWDESGGFWSCSKALNDGRRPWLGLRDVIPQQKAGFRTDPPMSLPRPSGDMPVAIADPSPPDDPPAQRPGCQGLRVRPCNGLSVLTRSPSSGRLVRPIGIPPADRMRSTIGASVGATRSANTGSPCVVGVPATSRFSFTVKGTPWKGPRSSPAAIAASAASASARASSTSTRTTALQWPLTSSMRPRWASTTSLLEASPEAIRADSSVAVRCHISWPIVQT